MDSIRKDGFVCDGFVRLFVEKGEFHRSTITIRFSGFNRVRRVSGVSRVGIRVTVKPWFHVKIKLL